MRKEIQNFKKRAEKMSMEEVRDVLIKYFTGESPWEAMDELDGCGLLGKFLPEVTALKGVKGDSAWHGGNDVYAHVRIMMGHLESHSSVEIVFSVLLHDIGKPSTFHKDENGKITFKNHAAVGAEMARKILRRLRFPKKQIEHIMRNVLNHMDYTYPQKKSEVELQKLLSRPNIEEELYLYKLDLIGCEGPCSTYTNEGVPESYDFLVKKLKITKKLAHDLGL